MSTKAKNLSEMFTSPGSYGIPSGAKCQNRSAIHRIRLHLIEKYSADGVRVGMLLCSPAGNDLLFDESLPEQGRNFANKMWNAFRLVKSWQTGPDGKPTDAARVP